jgi:urease accessory protein
MDWLVWQLADSALPTGGFAHSHGLEAAWQQGEVDRRSLPQFLDDAIAQAGRGALPFVTSAHMVPADLERTDHRCDAFIRNVVGNRASRVQGRAWLATVERSFPTSEVRGMCELARSPRIARHYAPLFGATLRVLGVDLTTTQRLFLYGVCRGVSAAAVRLGLVGTTDAQRLIAASAGHAERTIARSAGLRADEAAQTAPLIDLWQAAQDRLYSRLFQS